MKEISLVGILAGICFLYTDDFDFLSDRKVTSQTVVHRISCFSEDVDLRLFSLVKQLCLSLVKTINAPVKLSAFQARIP